MLFAYMPSVGLETGLSEHLAKVIGGVSAKARDDPVEQNGEGNERDDIGEKNARQPKRANEWRNEEHDIRSMGAMFSL